MSDIKMSIFPTGLTYSRNTKAPLEANKIFDTLAEAQAYIDNVDQTAYVGLTLSVVNDDNSSNNGLYYVEAIADDNTDAGVLVKVGSDTAADVAELTSRVATLETTTTPGAGLQIDESGNLAVNVGDGISVVEGALTVNLPEAASYEIVKKEAAEDGYAATYYLQKTVEGSTSQVGASINIVKDQFLKNVSFVSSVSEDDASTYGLVAGDPYLRFEWQLDTDAGIDGDQTVTYVAVKDLVDVYTAGSYITIENNQVSVNYSSLLAQVKSDIDLSKLTANVAANTSAIESLEDDVNNQTTGLSVSVAANTADIASLKTSVSTNTTDIATIKSSITSISTDVTAHAERISTVEDAVEELQKDSVQTVDVTAASGIALTHDATEKKVGISVDISSLGAALTNSDTSGYLNGGNIAVGADIMDGDATLVSKNDTITEAIELLSGKIQTAVAGGITSISGDDYISVSGTSTSRSLALNTDAVVSTVKSNIVSDTGTVRFNESGSLDIYWEEL